MTNLFGSTWEKEDLRPYVGNMTQLAGIQALEANDGAARGSRLFHVWTGGGLRFDVLAERALDIAACTYRGIPLAWISSVGSTHPAYYDAAGAGWLRSFGGGLLTTCGLDQTGPPHEDAGDVLGLHGRISNLPAYAVNTVAEWRGDEYILEISGKIRQTTVFGENLLLERRISTALGASKLRIEDRVTNDGFISQPHMLLYHFNLGFPLIGPETQLKVNSPQVVPRDADAARGLAQWQQFQEPTAIYNEQVFRHEPIADENGFVHVMVDNAALDLTLQLSYQQTTLPYLMQWKMMGQGMYVLGLEPTNCGVIEGRAVARGKGILPMLEPGEQCQYQLEIGIR